MKVLEYAAYVKKALTAAAGVLVAVVATVGVPTEAKQVALTVLGVLATFGVTYKVSNAPKP